MFHSQNHAVVHSESMTGQEITTENTANAPLEMRIYGASRQEQTAEPDSPSPDYPSEIKSAVDFEAGSTGKNLLYNKKAKSLNSSGLTFAVNCDGSITVNGVSTSPYGYRLGGGWNNADPVLYLQPGEYTMTTGPERLPPNCILSIFKAVNQSVAMCSDVRPITQFALTEETGITDINFATNVAGARYDNITIYPAIYKGSYTASTLPAYTPYVPPCQAAVNLPLRGIPDGSGGWAARDYIEVKDGIVRLVRECGEIAFDGTEVWHDYIATFDTVSHRLPHKHPVPALCTHGRYGGRYKGIFFGWASVDDIGFYPSRIGVDSVAGWKAWLAAQNTAGSPVKVVYALDVAQVTDITSTELGQALSGMKSVQYYTRIYHTSALPVEMEATITKLGRG